MNRCHPLPMNDVFFAKSGTLIASMAALPLPTTASLRKIPIIRMADSCLQESTAFDRPPYQHHQLLQ